MTLSVNVAAELSDWAEGRFAWMGSDLTVSLVAPMSSPHTG